MPNTIARVVPTKKEYKTIVKTTDLYSFLGIGTI